MRRKRRWYPWLGSAALLGGLFIEAAWWLLTRSPEFVKMRPSQAWWQSETEYWGDL